MIINNKYIYSSFTSFTKHLFNINDDCKYCKYQKIAFNKLLFSYLMSFLAKNTFTRPIKVIN
jgi:hypothetical protein